ncbi:MAG TPA: hypothetical protein VHT73_03780 [Thermodesulfobacteriota bacterium]|nr:hypothetical protein [Thermodesulfobacteriota bacterium]
MTGPASLTVVELYEPFTVEGLQKLDNEKWVAAGLLENKTGERLDLLVVKRVTDEPCQVWKL